MPAAALIADSHAGRRRRRLLDTDDVVIQRGAAGTLALLALLPEALPELERVGAPAQFHNVDAVGRPRRPDFPDPRELLLDDAVQQARARGAQRGAGKGTGGD